MVQNRPSLLELIRGKSKESWKQERARERRKDKAKRLSERELEGNEQQRELKGVDSSSISRARGTTRRRWD